MTDKDSVEWVIYQTLEDCERKKTDVAEDMNVPLSTLSREASPWDTGAKFGAGSLVSFMRATRSLAPLEYIAFKMGMRLVYGIHPTPFLRRCCRLVLRPATRRMGRQQTHMDSILPLPPLLRCRQKESLS